MKFYATEQSSAAEQLRNCVCYVERAGKKGAREMNELV